MRLLVLTNIPTPNQNEFFVTLSRACDLLVLYQAAKEPERKWRDQDPGSRYPHRFLPGVRVIRDIHWNGGVRREIERFRPDVMIISGTYLSPTFRVAARRAQAMGIPWLAWSEPLQDWSGLRRALLGRSRRLFVQAAHVLAIGTRAKEAFLALGVPSPTISLFPYVSDPGRFTVRSPRLETDEGPVRVVYCGSLIKRKNVEILLRALEAASSSRLTLTIVGTGPLQGQLSQLAATLGVSERVSFRGFIAPSDWPGTLATFDALALPSVRDGWGLVIEEALHSAVPVLVSDRVGASDLVQEGVNGRILPLSLDAWSGALREISDPRAISALQRGAMASRRPQALGGAVRQLLEIVETVVDPHG